MAFFVYWFHLGVFDVWGLSRLSFPCDRKRHRKRLRNKKARIKSMHNHAFFIPEGAGKQDEKPERVPKADPCTPYGASLPCLPTGLAAHLPSPRSLTRHSVGQIR
jgi:hypothetical protein